MSADGWAKLSVGDMKGAEEAFKASLAANPQDASSLHGLGKMALSGQQFEIAASLLNRAYKIAPENERLAIDFVQSLAGESVRHPQDAQAQFNLGLAFLGLGDIDSARDSLLTALLADPSHVGARWLVSRLLPRVYMSTAEIMLWRRRVFSGVSALEAVLHPQSPEEAAKHVAGILLRTNFELAYQGEDDRPLQELYGRLVHRVMSAWLPDLADPPKSRDRVSSDDKRIRVGFASSYFTSHTIALLFNGWIRHLDRSRFIIHGYLTNGVPDGSTRALAGLCDVFRDLKGPVEEAARQIRADGLDVLIYPDLGMDGRSFALAALKLAPTQAVSWGHPVTSGLPSMDYFLTSDLMEPDASDAHYCEKLIRLPNLSIAYRPPQLEQTKTRADFGLPATGPIYLCCQALQKYLPQYDRLFTAIAKQAAGARFAFILHKTRHLDNRKFKARIEAAFKAEGLNPADHLVFLPWMAWTDYVQLNGACDVFLDSVGWSGGNTSLEALSRNLPIVTMPSHLMRGRHSCAMLKLLGLDECIASDLKAYVAIAVKLGTDAAWNAAVRERIKAGQGRLFDDQAPVKALESFIEQAVAKS
ncbi:MAG: tetratricopeptide repeat protein [Alphaproteobacteria bacterium]|nr:tetratricopeptide repeat protein [Alphaproteobacteria bacterium]